MRDSANSVEKLSTRFIEEIHPELPPPKENTILSACGVYTGENSISDLLRFFFDPAENHGFKALFLAVFFRCLKVAVPIQRPDGISVSREVLTRNGNLIDLLITERTADGKVNWVLVIENKIEHHLANPLGDYEEHVTRLFPRDSPHLAILSPTGQKADGWKGVSYDQFADELDRAFLSDTFFSADPKWQYFARDLLEHIRTIILNRPMQITPQQIDFVERHAVETAHAHRLYNDYVAWLGGIAATRLNQELPGYDYYFYEEPKGWGTRLRSNKCQFHFVLRAPGHLNLPCFSIRVYPGNLSPIQQVRAMKILAGYRPEDLGSGSQFFDLPTPTDITKGRDAIEQIGVIARQFAILLRSEI